MKALTVQQPWAWAVVHADKRVENRTQLWRYRGLLAIHAGTRWSVRGAVDERVVDAADADRDANGVYDPPLHVVHQISPPRTLEVRRTDPRYVTGAIIGLCLLGDVHEDVGCCRPWGESSYAEHGGRRRTAVTHLILEDVRRLTRPVPCAGALGLWTVPDDLADIVTGEVAA